MNVRMPDISDTHLTILRELAAGTLVWGAAVGLCWPDLVRHGLVEPHFGGITPKGRALVEGLAVLAALDDGGRAHARSMGIGA